MKTQEERIQDLAAVIAGGLVGAAGYESGRMINPDEVADDAVMIARGIVDKTKPKHNAAWRLYIGGED